MSIRRTTARALLVAGVGLALAAFSAGAASAASGTTDRHHGPKPVGAVFLQNNGAAKNSVTAYNRYSDGTLTEAGTFPTGGQGGSEAGAVVDPLASQGGLTYDQRHELLFAVNAGSNTISVFGVHGAQLQLRQVLPSKGVFPASVSVAGDLAYVLNAGGDGSVSGYRIDGHRVHPLPDSTRSLGLGNADIPFFLSAPSQVAITPDRDHLVVATKNHNTLLTFTLRNGRPAPAPVVTASNGPVPFALTFDRGGNLQVAEASGAVSTYDIARSGALSVISGSVANGQAATCWSVTARGYLFAANAGSGTISSYQVHGNGSVSLVDATAAAPGAGAVDIAASDDGRYLYNVAAGAGLISVLKVGSDGSLTEVQQITGLPPVNGSGIEGIAAY